MSQSDEFGGWVPGSQLQDGPNSKVVRATNGDRTAILKICPSKKQEKRTFQRFEREIRTLRECRDIPGVMPLIDYSDFALSGDRRLWYVMPEAVPFDSAFKGVKPRLVVAGIRDVALTLQELQARGVNHRDVKPANLFRLNKEHLVGDLGLVTTPYDVDPAITQVGDRMGPANYMAHEMLQYDSSVDPGPADVYSLAKVLWAILNEQTYPLPGPQRVVDQTSLTRQLDDQAFEPLDRLIEKATSNSPGERPKMREFSDALQEWLEEPNLEAESDELQEAIKIAKRRLADPQQKQKYEDQLRTRAMDVFLWTLREFNPAFEAMKQIGSTFDERGPDDLADATLSWPSGETMGGPQTLSSLEQTSVAEIGSIPNKTQLRMTIRLVTDESENSKLAAGLLVNEVPTVLSTSFCWSDSVEGNVNSPALENSISRLRDALVEQLPGAIESFVNTADPGTN